MLLNYWGILSILRQGTANSPVSQKEISLIFSNLNPIVIIFVKMILQRLWRVLLFLTQRS